MSSISNNSPSRQEFFGLPTTPEKNFLIPPPAPKKSASASISRLFASSPFATPCANRKRKAEETALIMNELSSLLPAIGEKIGSGDGCDVYELGDRKVVKIPKKGSSLLSKEIELHQRVRLRDMPISLEPIQIVMIQRKAKPFDVENDLTDEVVDKIAEMFAYCLENNLPMDIKPANLGWINDELVMIDGAVDDTESFDISLQSLINQFPEEIRDRIDPRNQMNTSSNMSKDFSLSRRENERSIFSSPAILKKDR